MFSASAVNRNISIVDMNISYYNMFIITLLEKRIIYIFYASLKYRCVCCVDPIFLTHCGLVLLYGIIELCYHWIRLWLGADCTKPKSEPLVIILSIKLVGLNYFPTRNWCWKCCLQNGSLNELDIDLTHLPVVPHFCISESRGSGQQWFR